MRKERLPIAQVIDGKLYIEDPFEDYGKITCVPYGMMSDGSMVWQNIEAYDDRQYARVKYFGKYFFQII